MHAIRKVNNMSEEIKNEECKKGLRPHPTTVLKYTVEGLKQGLTFEKAKEKARERALAEHKYHGISKLKVELCELLSEGKGGKK